MIQVDADILLIDEVLAVGDAAFQQKCYDEFARIRRSGTTVLFVTHDMNAVQRFCDRARAARARAAGRARRARARRRPLPGAELLARRPRRRGARGRRRRRAEPRPRSTARRASRCAWATAGRRSSRRGSRTSRASAAEVLRARQPCSFHARVRVNERLEDPLVGVNFQNSAGEHVWGANNLKAEPLRRLRARRRVHLRPALHELPGPRPLLGDARRGQERRRPGLARPPPALRLGDGDRRPIPRRGWWTSPSRSTSSARGRPSSRRPRWPDERRHAAPDRGPRARRSRDRRRWATTRAACCA